MVVKSVSEAVCVCCTVMSTVSVETVVVWVVVERSVPTTVAYTVGRTVIVEVTVLVAGVTVTARRDEQSRTPFLVVNALPRTAVPVC
jgi:hypothetical protein